MDRYCLKNLQDWLDSNNRKPLVMRGARQVGKTWAIRQLAKMTRRLLIEINLENTPQLVSLFQSNDPKVILTQLEANINQPINPEKSLLFLDEIQEAPELLAKLRWFAEDLPELPVVAAGSLLEFALSDHIFSMPVGRINYMHIEPLSFEEFLLAQDKKILREYLAKYTFEQEIPIILHEKLTALFKEYILIGGMPAAVASWIQDRSPVAVNQIHHDLLATFRDDFAKYKGRIEIETLDRVMNAIPKMLGNKFVYRNIDPELQTRTLKQALDLLTKARICHRVVSCDANGVPLGAEVNEKYFKMIFLDTGLACATLGLTLNQVYALDEINLINNGGIAEQVTGQLLRTLNPFYIEPNLYYWQRDAKGSNAEIDYILQYHNKLFPIEVKAGKTGSLKSLHLFMETKKLPMAIRINADLPSKVQVQIKSQQGNDIAYTLLSLPVYLLEQIHRLLEG